MAFTIAHPAAVIPLRHCRQLALLPLIIGSMTPDLVNFLPYFIERRLPHSHSLTGSVLVDVPAGMLILWLLGQARAALVRPLWEPHRSWIDHGIRDYFNRPNPWLMALPSLWVGSLTHLIWDLFTHWSYFSYRYLPWLQRPLFPDSEHVLPVFHALQYGTSVIGLLLLGWCYWRAIHTAPQPADPSATTTFLKKILLSVIGVAILLGCVRFLIKDHDHQSIYSRVSLVLKTGIMSFSVLYLLCGMLLTRALPRAPELQPIKEKQR